MKEVRCEDGGRMLEVYRSEEWGQVNVRTIPPGVRVGGHRHPRTNERWLLLRGDRVAVTLGSKDQTFQCCPWEIVDVPAGVGHIVENFGDDEAVLLFWRDRLYDPRDVDKEPWDGNI